MLDECMAQCSVMPRGPLSIIATMKTEKRLYLAQNDDGDRQALLQFPMNKTEALQRNVISQLSKSLNSDVRINEFLASVHYLKNEATRLVFAFIAAAMRPHLPISFEEADAEVGIILSRFEEQFYEKCEKVTKFGQSCQIKVDVQQAHGMPSMTTEMPRLVDGEIIAVHGLNTVVAHSTPAKCFTKRFHVKSPIPMRAHNRRMNSMPSRTSVDKSSQELKHKSDLSPKALDGTVALLQSTTHNCRLPSASINRKLNDYHASDSSVEMYHQTQQSFDLGHAGKRNTLPIRSQHSLPSLSAKKPSALTVMLEKKQPHAPVFHLPPIR